MVVCWFELVKRTCLTCCRVRVPLEGAGDAGADVDVRATVVAAPSCSVAAVAHEASLADVSNTELTSGLLLLSDASYRTPMLACLCSLYVMTSSANIPRHVLDTPSSPRDSQPRRSPSRGASSSPRWPS